MPEQQTLERAKRDKAEGKSASTQAGEFVREEIHHIREGKHGARSAKQAIAIGLSKARRAGVALKTPPKSAGSDARRQATRDRAAARSKRKPSPGRSRGARKALQGLGRSAASPLALARHARASARTRTKRDRSAAAKRGARTRARGGR